MTLHPLNFSLPARRLRTCREFFRVDQLPGTPVFERSGAVIIVLRNSLGQIGGVTHVKVTAGKTPQDVSVEGHECSWWAPS